jgi:hypothetical protein
VATPERSLSPEQEVVVMRRRDRADYRVRIPNAIEAGIVGAILFVAGYYLTLGLLPPATGSAATAFPTVPLAHRFDLAQFFGSLVLPPVPRETTWWVGFVILLGSLVSFSLIYAILFSWAMRTPTRANGLFCGGVLWIGILVLISTGGMWHPAIMRNALPDTGLLMLGWTSWAPLQLLVLTLIYGAAMGSVYRRGLLKDRERRKAAARASV